MRKKCINTYLTCNKPARFKSNFCSIKCRLMYEGKILIERNGPPDTLEDRIDRITKAKLKLIKHNDEFIESLPEGSDIKKRYEGMWRWERQWELDHLKDNVWELSNKYLIPQELEEETRGVKEGTKRGSYKTKDNLSICEQCKNEYKSLRDSSKYCSTRCRQKAYRLRGVNY